jgi:hypothetical protein
MGQVLYYRPVGSPGPEGDYVSNYREVRVGSFKDGYVRIVGANKFAATVKAANVLTEEEYQRKRAALIKAGKAFDPNWRSYWRHKPSKNLDKVLPPKIDQLSFNKRVDPNQLVLQRELGSKAKKQRGMVVSGFGSRPVRARRLRGASGKHAAA